MAILDNVQGHLARFKWLITSKPRDEAMRLYVGGAADAVSIGHREKEAIARHADIAGAYVIDIGCGVGRLTRHLVGEPIGRYLGTDVVLEVMREAEKAAGADRRFAFELVSDTVIPADDECADIVCAFSVMTHLMNEEVFRYFREASRVLKRGGVAVFSFLDFGLPSARQEFVRYAKTGKERPDVLAWIEKSTLRFFARRTGFEIIEFQDSGAQVPAKFPNRKLENGAVTGPTFSLGQSLVYLKKVRH